MTNKKIIYGIVAVSLLATLGIATTVYAASSHGHLGLRHHYDKWTDKFSDLGINSDQLKTDIDSGQTFEEALNNQDVTKEDLMAQKRAMMKTKLDELVASGELTQEEADNKLEMINNHTFNKDGSKLHKSGLKRHFKPGNWGNHKK